VDLSFLFSYVSFFLCGFVFFDDVFVIIGFLDLNIWVMILNMIGNYVTVLLDLI